MKIICVKLKDRYSFHSCTTCGRAPSWINEKDSGMKDHDEECRVKISDLPRNVDIPDGFSVQISSDRTEIVIPYIQDNDGCGVYQNCPLWIPIKKMKKECEGCTHGLVVEDGYCYMFEEAPKELPCGQHDKFAEQRRLTGKLIRKNPQILAMMIGAIGR